MGNGRDISGNTIEVFKYSSSELYNRITLDKSGNQFIPHNGILLSNSELNLITQWNYEGASHQKIIHIQLKENVLF